MHFMWGINCTHYTISMVMICKHLQVSATHWFLMPVCTTVEAGDLVGIMWSSTCCRKYLLVSSHDLHVCLVVQLTYLLSSQISKYNGYYHIARSSTACVCRATFLPFNHAYSDLSNKQIRHGSKIEA